MVKTLIKTIQPMMKGDLKMAEELTYRTEGDYLIPNLTVPEGGQTALGKYALLRKKYLKQNRRILYVDLLTAGTLGEHLAEIERAASGMMERITRRMAAERGVDERMKAADQMKWAGMMNEIRNSAEETVLSGLIYA